MQIRRMQINHRIFSLDSCFAWSFQYSLRSVCAFQILQLTRMYMNWAAVTSQLKRYFSHYDQFKLTFKNSLPLN